jgi:flavorubredoxin
VHGHTISEGAAMTRISEIVDDVYQISTYIPEADFSLNQYLVAGEEPLLFHTGMRHQFGAISEAIARVVPPASLRWIAFGHLEADECGSMNDWLALAPQATVVQSTTGCMISVGDLADRSPRPLADGETIEIGRHRMRWIDTPHVPHGWEAGLLYDEITHTLLCGDLFAQMGAYEPMTDGDLLGPALTADEGDGYAAWSLAPQSGSVIRSLAGLEMDTLAPMHGPAFAGNCRRTLEELAHAIDAVVAARRTSDT